MDLERQRGWLMSCNATLFQKNVKVFKCLTCTVSVLRVFQHLLLRVCMHQCPHLQQARPLDCSRAEVGASLATKRVQQYIYNAHPDLLWLTVQHRDVQYAASVEMTSMIRYKLKRDLNRYDSMDSYIHPLTPSRTSCMHLAYFYIAYIFPQFILC